MTTPAPELAYHCEKCGAPPRTPCFDVDGNAVPSHPRRVAWVARAARVAHAMRPRRSYVRRANRGEALAAFAKKQRRARKRRKARGWCINHDNVPATSGVLCAPCRETHRRSA